MLSYLCKHKSYRRLSIMERKSNHFSGQLGFVLAAAGSAVGVGNLWRFPYLAAKDGGGLFLIIYFILVLTFGFTLLTSDIAIGRRTQKSAIGAYAEMKPKWKFLGILTFLVPVLIMTYYAVIGGWITKYAVVYLTGQAKAAAADDYFTSFITSSTSPVIFALIFMGVTAFIVYNGVQDGIEKVSKWMMPVLLVLVVIISIYSLTLKHTDSSGQVHTGIQGFLYYLTPNLEGLTVQRFLQILLDAMSQLFFSLSVSMGIMITYGSYLQKKENLQKNAILIIVMDTMVALMAGLCVIPGRFALDPEGALGGPSLLFVTMQNVFSRMGGLGPIFGILFYLLVVFAAISSSISLLEAVVAHFVDKARDSGKGDKRKKYTFIAAVAVGVGAILICADSLGGADFTPWKFLGLPEADIRTWNDCWLDFFDMLSEGIMMPLGAMLMSLMIGWEIGPEVIKGEVEQSGHAMGSYSFFKICVKFITPLCMILILYGQIKEFFF